MKRIDDAVPHDQYDRRKRKRKKSLNKSTPLNFAAGFGKKYQETPISLAAKTAANLRKESFMANSNSSYDLVFRALHSLRQHGITNPAQQRSTLHKMAQASPAFASQLANFERSLIKEAAEPISMPSKEQMAMIAGLPGSLQYLSSGSGNSSGSSAKNQLGLNEAVLALKKKHTPVKNVAHTLEDVSQYDESGLPVSAGGMDNIRDSYEDALKPHPSPKSEDSASALANMWAYIVDKYQDISNRVGDQVGTFYANNKGKVLGGGAAGLAALAALAYMLRRRSKGKKEEEKEAAYLRPLLQDKNLVTAINTYDGPAKALALCHELGIESETKIASVVAAASEPEELVKFAALLGY